MLQWHVDGAFYGKLPPAVTALQCAEAPTSVPKAHSFDDAEPLQYKVRETPSSFFEPFVDYKRQVYQDRLGTSIGKAETIRRFSCRLARRHMSAARLRTCSGEYLYDCLIVT
eukprot:COSAG06_NODE_26971_length_603_cov_47.876984_1_plen_112_part_00